LAAPPSRSLVWIKEEGLEMPPPAALMADRGWRVRVLGLHYDGLRRLRIGRWVRALVTLWHALLVRFGLERATLVVGVHYAGICCALLRSIPPRASYAVVVDSVYVLPDAVPSTFVGRLMKRGLASSDAVLVNSAELAEQLLARQLVANEKQVFVVRDPPPPPITSPRPAYRYAFSGGISARDWQGLHDIVRATNQDMQWIVACPPSVAPLFAGLANVEVMSNIAIEQFDSLVARADIVVVPLAGTHVAGVTLIRGAQAAGAFVIAYGPAFLTEYIASGVDGVVALDQADAARWVRIASGEERDVIAMRSKARQRIESDRRNRTSDDVRLAAFLEHVEASCASRREIAR